MVIWPAFRMWQYRVNDHPYHASQFIRVYLTFELKKSIHIRCQTELMKFLLKMKWIKKEQNHASSWSMPSPCWILVTKVLLFSAISNFVDKGTCIFIARFNPMVWPGVLFCLMILVSILNCSKTIRQYNSNPTFENSIVLEHCMHPEVSEVFSKHLYNLLAQQHILNGWCLMLSWDWILSN